MPVLRAGQRRVTSGGGSPAFDPSSLSWLFWMDPAVGKSLTGSVVNSWASAVGAISFNEIAGSGPLYVASGINSQPSIQYNGTSEFLRHSVPAAFYSDKDFSFYIACNGTNAEAIGALFSERSSTANTRRVAFYFDTRNATFAASNYAPDGTSRTINWASEQAIGTKIISVVKNGANLNLWDGGVLVGTVSSSATFPGSPNSMQLGQQQAGNVFFTGQMGDVFYATSAHDATTRQNMEAWLAAKYIP